ncbi:hypothetical protein NQK81_13365 [Amycolatopsis roodepoortensis]|uniref:hypothetical protein n=1 Tax=Amycolatopsis roodepoortensis TaxID=700274 RepID=UPI00214B5960|nr:hypothetical protein [Amycolatopsis roodepoortensis]UUV34394.1 hypothetical protein NQK81_13365 [Amycolatopsis roodepoortensis]
MDTSMEKRVVRLGDDPLVDWVSDPVFEFDSEVEAMQMLDAIACELSEARAQAHHAMRFLKAAIRAAGEFEEDGHRISASAIIDFSGLARQTVYAALPADRRRAE